MRCHRRWAVLGSALVVAAASTSTAKGDVTVNIYHSYSGGTVQHTDTFASGEGWTFTLDADDRRVNIVPDTSSDDIGKFIFTNGPPSEMIHIIIGSSDLWDGSEPTTKFGRDLQGLHATGLFDGQLRGAINGDVTDTVNLDGIEYLVVSDITSSIYVTDDILSFKGSGTWGADGGGAIVLDVGGAVLTKLDFDGKFSDNLTIDIGDTVKRFRGAINGNSQPFKADFTC